MTERKVTHESIRIDKKEFEILLGVLDRRIHRAIELDQLIVLSAEILKDKLSKNGQKLSPNDFKENVESVSSKGSELGAILQEVRKRLNEILTTEERND